MRQKLTFTLGLLSIFAFSTTGSAQDCATHPTQQQIDFLNQTREVRQNYQIPHSRSTINYPIQFHVLRRSDGTGGLSAATVNGLLTSFNTHYAPAKLQFFQCGPINFINSDTYFSLTTSEESAMGAAHDVSKVINIYLVDYAGGYCGWTRLPPSKIDRIILKNSCATNGSTAIHEVGHYFSLYHTHGKTNTGTTDELVNGSNCSTAGDDVCDTPADPNLSGKVNSSCAYTGTATDANNQVYTPDPKNMMSYSRKACRTKMTAGQFARVAYSAANDRSYLTCSNNPISCNTTISSFPYNEGFESGLGNWVQGAKDNTDWTRKSGATGSSNTGPSAANEGSYYMYVEASSPNYPSKKANLMSPCFNFTGITSPQLTFQYHMFGASMGSLAVQASTDGGNTWSANLWSKSGNQTNAWKSASVNLSAYGNNSSVRLRFAGVTGSSFTSDMAVDKIKVSGSSAVTYCTAKGNNTNYEYINSVKIGSKTNTSGNNSGYFDYSAQTMTVTTGNTPVILTPGYASTNYNEHWRIYIDFNGDGDFTDAGETVFTGSGSGAVNGNISGKAGMTSPTKMRVVMNYSSSVSPCGTFTYGEVEDYTVILGTSADNENNVVNTVKGNTFDSNISVYPNPSSGLVNIEFFNHDEETLQLMVTDQMGRTVLMKEQGVIGGNNRYTIDLSHLPSGYYFIQLNSASIIKTERVFISH